MVIQTNWSFILNKLFIIIECYFVTAVITVSHNMKRYNCLLVTIKDSSVFNVFFRFKMSFF